MSRLRAVQVAFLGTLLYALGSCAATAFVRYRLWSDHELVGQLLDNTWQLELAWRAALGEWSGRDFHYTMGPLWQALLWFSSGGLPIDARRALVGTQLVFSLLCVGITGLLIWRLTLPSWKRVALLAVGATLSFAAGPATLRAVASSAVILLYGTADERSPKRELATPIAATLAMLLSFDRGVLAIGCIVAMSGYELLARYRRGEQPRLALSRFLRWAGLQAACLGALSLVALPFGANPIAYLRGQRTITADYGSALASAWRLGVRRETIFCYVAAAAALAIAIGVSRRSRWRAGALIAGAFPPMAFALVQPDDGHVYLALEPMVLVLAVIALEPTETAGRVTRTAAGLLTYLFLVGWFVTHPDALWLSPRALSQAWSTYRGHKQPEIGYATDLGSALLAVERSPQAGCLAVSPPLAALHPLSGRRGPTELPLTWSYERQRERDDAIMRARCPEFVHFFVAYDSPDHPGGWRSELVTEAELYRHERQLSPATHLLRLRETPKPLLRRPIGFSVSAPSNAVPIPGKIQFALERPIAGDRALELEYTFEVSALALRLGGRPVVDISFEKAGIDVSGFSAPMRIPNGHRVRVVIGPDPEAFERRAILGLGPLRQTQANGFSVKLTPTGLLSPKRAHFELHSVTEIAVAEESPASEASCVKAVDLLKAADRGELFERDFAPVTETGGLWITANPPGENIAELAFPIRPCNDACFRSEVSVKAGAGDGVDLEAHVLDRESRTRLVSERLPAGSQSTPLELPLYMWSGRDVLFRLGLRPGDDIADNRLFLHAPRIEGCSCRRRMADALRDGVASIAWGKAWANGDDVEFAAPGGEVVQELWPYSNTCFSADVTLEGQPPPALRAADAIVVMAHFKIADLRHRLFRAELHPGQNGFELQDHSLHDYIGERGELILSAEFPTGSGDLRAVVRHPRVGRCGQP